MTASGKVKTAVLISGSGTNLQSLIDAAQENEFPADIALVISNKATAFGLERARQAGIETATISHKEFDSRKAFDQEMHKALEAANIDFVCLAGFMRILTEEFVAKWTGRMLNIHPSLLPSFRGHNAHEQVLSSSVAFSGCTVHAVTAELDGGPIVGQAVVPRYANDTEETLSARVRTAEHQLYPQAISMFLRDDNKPVPESASALLNFNPSVRFKSC
ncbi:MAG: phosphoribosylglycinamide formyltransferase [Pseudomonadota bacterium]